MLKTVLLSFYLFCLSASFRDPGNINTDQKKTLLKILISKTHHYYYYENELEMDGANFKITTYKGVIEWGDKLKREKGSDNIAFILKMQQKDSLNSDSKKLLDYVKEQKHYQIASLTEVEKEFIRVTEQAYDSD
jgi:hypothetical protein